MVTFVWALKECLHVRNPWWKFHHWVWVFAGHTSTGFTTDAQCHSCDHHCASSRAITCPRSPARRHLMVYITWRLLLRLGIQTNTKNANCLSVTHVPCVLCAMCMGWRKSRVCAPARRQRQPLSYVTITSAKGHLLVHTLKDFAGVQMHVGKQRQIHTDASYTEEHTFTSHFYAYLRFYLQQADAFTT